MITIFILDWRGTLDILEDTNGFLKDLRERYPGCQLALNTGLPSAVPQDSLLLFDYVYAKRQETEILEEIVEEITSSYKLIEPIAGKAIDQVVVVDDGTWYPEDMILGIKHQLSQAALPHIEVFSFRSVHEMERSLV